MLKYILKRVLLMIPTILGITLVTFAVLHIAMSDPAQGLGGEYAQNRSPEAHQLFLEAHGFDKPVPVQYVMWLSDLIRLDFRNSLVDGRPVIEVIKEKLPVTIYLNFLSLLVIYIISIPSGILAAVNKDKWFDKLSGGIFFVFYSLFVPLVAIILISIFSVSLGWLPLYGITSDYHASLSFSQKVVDLVSHTVLPVIVLSYSGFAFLSRITRGSVLEVLDQEYINTARAKGLPERKVIGKHAMRNSLITLVTLFGSILPSLIGGSVIVEKIFNIDGIGNLFFFSIKAVDYDMIMGLTTFTAILTLFGILLSDILYAIVDPRIRYN